MDKNDTAPMRGTDVTVAMMLLTRVPVGTVHMQAFDRQAQATWAFPLAGLAVSLPVVAVGLGAIWAGLPEAVAAGAALTVQIFLTGAMHHDGLADSADGFWGGFAPERRLEIMKDSRIGTYGVLALVLAVGLQWQLAAMLLSAAPAGIVAAAALSRAALPAVMAAMPPARSDGLSRKVGRPGPTACTIGGALAALIAVCAVGWIALAAILAVTVIVSGVALLARHKIGGQTGDVLGAAQVAGDIAALAVLGVLST